MRLERADRGIDRGAAFFLALDRGALLFGAALFGDIFVRGNPAAARQWLIFGEHDAAVARLNIVRHRLAMGHFFQDLAAVGLDVAFENAGVLAVLNEPLKRAARLHDVGRQLVHFEVAPVQKRDAALCVEDIEALRHVIDRVREATEFRALPFLEDVRNCQCRERKDGERSHLPRGIPWHDH